LIIRATAIDVVEVQTRRSKIVQHVRVVLAHQRRCRIKRDVMIDELAKIRVASRNLGIEFLVEFFPLGGIARDFARRQSRRFDHRSIGIIEQEFVNSRLVGRQKAGRRPGQQVFAKPTKGAVVKAGSWCVNN